MFGAIAGGIASALAGGAMSKLFGGGQKAASGGIQGDVLATDNNTVGIFIQEPPSGDLQERVLIRHHDYDQCFQSVQLLQWNSQVKFNVTVYRNLPTTRDSIMTS